MCETRFSLEAFLSVRYFSLNLSQDQDIKDDDIRAHFSDCGEISAVRVVRDKFSGLSKGIAFVTFKATVFSDCYLTAQDPYAIPLALSKDQTTVGERTIRVSKCYRY